MAIKGWYLTRTDGGSAAGGVAQGIRGMVTFTGASGLTPEGSSNVELIYNDAGITNKNDLLRALERFQAAIINDTWPPTGQF